MFRASFVQLLAGAGFATNEHGGIGGRHASNGQYNFEKDGDNGCRPEPNLGGPAVGLASADLRQVIAFVAIAKRNDIEEGLATNNV